MLGPVEVKNLVLCTAGSDAPLSRYAASRLSAELPGVRTHVFYQDPETAQSPRAPGQMSIAHWKKQYWQFRADWRRPRWAFCKHLYLNRWQRQVNRLLLQDTQTRVQPEGEQEVAGVNAHVNEMKALNPDVLLILGGQKVSAEVLATATVAMNIHCGSLPSYRGVKSVFFALAEGRPDQVGVTLHEATPDLDAGRILKWQRVEPSSARSISELLFKLTRTGLDMAIETVRALPHGPIPARHQTGTSRMFRMKDFNQDIVRQARHNFRCLTNDTAPGALPNESPA